MWENERKKIIIRNIIIFLLLVLIVAGLGVTMLSVYERIAIEDELLKAEHSSQRQEQNEARQENLAAVQLAYEKDLEAVAQYLPGVVCWGDSLTTGSSGNVSYPLTLQKYINTYLCDIYDLRYGIENPENYSRLNWDGYKVFVPVVNMGAGQEDSATILGRSGVIPYVVNKEFVIPAGMEGVDITLVSQSGANVSPLTAGNAGINPVTIAGVEGTLTRTVSSSNWEKPTYQFTRLEAGEETQVVKGTEILTACKEEYRDYIHIVWLGTYDTYKNPETLISDTKALLQRQAANPDRYLVIGPCTVGGKWAAQNTKKLDTLDAAMLQEFGSRYINLRKYLMEDGLRDAGISPTKDDTASVAKGMVPNSLRSNASGADLNGVAYELLGKLVYDRMELLGYFEEVRQELKLDKITQDILKSNPDYFDTLLK